MIPNSVPHSEHESTKAPQKYTEWLLACTETHQKTQPPIWGKRLLRNFRKKEISLQTALERQRCTQDSPPFKGQLRAATWPLCQQDGPQIWYSSKGSCFFRMCPPPIPSNAVCFHLHFLSSWVWKLVSSQLKKNTWSPSYSWKMVRSGNPCTHSQVSYQLDESITPSTRHQIAHLVTLLSRIPQFISSTPHCTPGLPTLVAHNPNKTLQSMWRLLLPRSYFSILLCGPLAKAKSILLNWLYFTLDMVMSWMSVSNGHVTTPFSNGFKTSHHGHVKCSTMK